MQTRTLGWSIGPQSLRGRRLSLQWVRVVTVAALWMVSTGIAAEGGPTGGRLPDFDEMERTALRKQRFFEYLSPMIRSENALIRRQRGQLVEIAKLWRAGQRLGWLEHSYLEWLAGQYRLDGKDIPPGALIGELLLRVDVIPRSLVLAQAAKESGWGGSRFARRANNLFGQWCFEQGCGVVPRRRPAGMTHEVRTFRTVRDSVASYMQNLNTHERYRDLRALRARLRVQDLPLSGVLLAEALDAYSERGDRYVRELQNMILQNGLEDGVTHAVAGS